MFDTLQALKMRSTQLTHHDVRTNRNGEKLVIMTWR